ncbi:adenosine deaminase [Lecanosticta acicola]|uniref:Adenosine deaminase n=1 Tax=Lecanosticta acicola TaxID=111012 RepID=A0AAI9E523_9PEZI|nr:adenosine deaminase [Lecanosticta acicola]
MDGPVDAAFTKALPKAELHAHLTGSISPQCLHNIWKQNRESAGDLEDPLVACRPEGQYHDIFTFFKVFDTYIYGLVNDREAVAFATRQVLQDFAEDGVCYLELRTTPRESLVSGLTKETYVETVLDVIAENNSKGQMSTYLILSIDRRNNVQQAMQVADLALKYRSRGVVGIDLCGNPLKGDVGIFREAFDLARSHDLKITLHFAEMPESSSHVELMTLLSYRPDRIGHVINVPSDIEAEIERRNIGLELCLSCNVHAKMISGGFANHHFGKWYHTRCPLALCTDDVGIFGSSISNEYLLAAQHFNLAKQDLIELSRRAITSTFGPAEARTRFLQLLDDASCI